MEKRKAEIDLLKEENSVLKEKIGRIKEVFEYRNSPPSKENKAPNMQQRGDPLPRKLSKQP